MDPVSQSDPMEIFLTCKRFFLAFNARFDPSHIGKRAIISKAEYAID